MSQNVLLWGVELKLDNLDVLESVASIAQCCEFCVVYEVCYLAVFSKHLTCHLVFNPLTTILVSSDFGCMLSVGAIRFEDRFCTSGKGRWVHHSA